MSVVIIGGHDRMVCNYKNICKQHKCKAKIFTQMPGDFKKQIGNPDFVYVCEGACMYGCLSGV